MAVNDILPLFAARAAQGPNKLAVSAPDQRLTYADLDRLSTALALDLTAQGLQPGDRIGLRMLRSSRLIVAILAAWKAELCYVPLDPMYPSERTTRIVEHARLAAILEEDRLIVDGGEPAPDRSPSGYLIFTSGSTGSPKGVPISRSMVAEMLRAAIPKFDFRATDHWAMMHSYNFDFSVWELWGALTTGASLHIPPQEVINNPIAAVGYLADEEISILNQVPSVFSQLAFALEDLGATIPSVRHVIFGGEDIRRAEISTWRATGSCALLSNMYGITEVTVHATWHRLGVDNADADDSVIGQVLPGLTGRVVDSELRDVADGIVGELLLSGAQVATAYFRDDAQTKARMHRADDRIWYRTGDLVRRDGRDLHYVGRMDSQVQVRGFRIEIAEIEHAIRRSGIARGSAVFTVERMAGLQLVAVFVPANEYEDATASLREYLNRQLPSYMVPSRLTPVPVLPRTASGKVDTRLAAERFAVVT